MSYYKASSTDLTAVANAIRTRGGTSSQLEFPNGYVSAVQAIANTYTQSDEGKVVSNGALVAQTSDTVTTNDTYDTTLINSLTVNVGSGDTLTIKGTTEIVLLHETNMPVKYKIQSANIYKVAFETNGEEGGAVAPSIPEIEEVVIEPNSQTTGMLANARFAQQVEYALKKIDLGFVPLRNIYSFSAVYFNKLTQFESLLGLNFSLVGGSNYCIGTMGNFHALKNVTVKPNTLGQLDLVATNRNWWKLTDSSLLTDDSLISIANGLCATYTSVLTLHATPKARCDSLMGTVSSVTDDTGTYNFFTADANGSVSLTSFITTTKGWTLA